MCAATTCPICHSSQLGEFHDNIAEEVTLRLRGVNFHRCRCLSCGTVFTLSIDYAYDESESVGKKLVLSGDGEALACGDGSVSIGFEAEEKEKNDVL